MRKVFKEAELSKIASSILEKIKPKENAATVIGLYGDLGAGKTALTQAIAKELNISDQVISPTYVIMKRYLLRAMRYENLIHIDAYRLKNGDDLTVLGWQEIISRPKNLVLVEWPEKVSARMPPHMKIHLTHQESDTREIVIEEE